MTDVDSAPSSASFNLSAYKEPALLLLALAVPPAAIAVGKGKADLESRHLALSLALYFSIICYFPAVVHAYWLLYVRDNGGLQEWSGARLKQAQGLWNEHGGVAKTTVDKYSPMVIEKFEPIRTYAVEKVKYVRSKKDETIAHVAETRAAARELYEEAKEAYAAGTLIDWSKQKLHAAVEKLKALLESFPRLQAFVRYVEQRAPPFLDFFGNILGRILGQQNSNAL